MKRYHYVYKIEDTINNMEYIGVHSTNNLNDDYMGTSIPLKEEIKKHGMQFFKKTILDFFNDRDSAMQAERELVDHDYVNRKDTYNQKLGGVGIKSSIGTIAAKDAFGNRILVPKDDPRWLSGELVGIRKGMKNPAH